MDNRPLFDAEELEALRSAINQSKPSATIATPAAPRTAMSIALIADDRTATQARPSGLKIANRWGALARSRLIQLAGAKLELDGVGAEIIDGPSLRDELASTWTECVEVVNRPGLAMVSIGGPMIEAIAARFLGATDEVIAERPPSATAIRIFSPVGQALLGALAEAWREEQNCQLRLPDDPESTEKWRHALVEAEVVVVTTVALSGDLNGRLRLLARPETLVAPPTPVKAFAPPPEVVEEVLGDVPVQVRVQLGVTHLTMTELSVLQPGVVLALDRFVDDPLPIYCAGVVKAYGRAVVTRGAMAVEVVQHENEGKHA